MDGLGLAHNGGTFSLKNQIGSGLFSILNAHKKKGCKIASLLIQ